MSRNNTYRKHKVVIMELGEFSSPPLFHFQRKSEKLAFQTLSEIKGPVLETFPARIAKKWNDLPPLPQPCVLDFPGPSRGKIFDENGKFSSPGVCETLVIFFTN